MPESGEALPTLEWGALVGPGRIPCERSCEVPEGVELVALPEARHAWPGIVSCPNGCGRSFEVRRAVVGEPALLGGDAATEEARTLKVPPLSETIVGELADCGVSPCFAHCGEPACHRLGCIRVYNARHRAEIG